MVLPPMYPYNVAGGPRQIKQLDFDDNIDILPVSYPNIFSMSQRVTLAQNQLQLAQSNPQMHNIYEAYRRMYVALGVKDIEQVFEYFPILKERMNQPAGLLSGGEQQMLCISRALMSKPEIMLLDEPSLGLSPKLVKEIFEIIIRINKELKTTILLVEQNANIALSNSDFGYVLELGRIVMEGNSKELLEKEDIKEFYLGQQDEGIRGERRWKKKKMWR